MKKNIFLLFTMLFVLLAACGQSSTAPLGVTVKGAEYVVDNLGEPCIRVQCEQKGGFGDLIKDGVDASEVRLTQIRLMRKNGNDWELVTQFFDKLNNSLAENQSTTVSLYPKQPGENVFDPLFLEEGEQYRLELVLEVSYVTLSSTAPPPSDEYPLPTVSIKFA